MTTPEEKLNNLQLELPPTPTSKGVYKTYIIAGNFIHLLSNSFRQTHPFQQILESRVGT
jgi:hypothetical protein